MISAGTIAAYLRLDISKFDRSVNEAIQMLSRLTSSSGGSSEAFERMSTTIGTAAGAMSGSLVSAVNRSTSGFRTAVQSYALAMSDASIRVNEKVSAAKNSLLSIGNCSGEVNAKSQLVADAVKSPFKTLDTDAYGLMGNVGDGLRRGLLDKKGLIVSAAKNIADAVTGTLRSVLKIASPSKVMKQIGEQTVQGLSIGLTSGVSSIGRSADAMAMAITGRDYSVGTAAGSGGDISQLAGRLDQLITLLSGSEQTMQVDGRVFARLIKEYS